MSTHGLCTIKVGEWVWGFHLLADGYDVYTFMKRWKGKKHVSVETILMDAFSWFADGDYDDRSYTNIFHKRFDPDENYANMTHCNCYFDGNKWSSDQSD